MSFSSLCPPILSVLVLLFLLVTCVSTYDNTWPIKATRVHHMIMKRQPSSSPPQKHNSVEQGNHDVHSPRSNNSDHNFQEKLNIRLPVTASEISNESESIETSLLNNVQTSERESEATPTVQKSGIRSSKGNHSESDSSHHSTIIKSTQAHLHKHHHHHHNQSHHHHNHSHHHHQHQNDHKPTKSAQERNNHMKITQALNRQLHHHPHHHHHHHHHHGGETNRYGLFVPGSFHNTKHQHLGQNDYHNGKTNDRNVFVPGSPLTIKQLIQAPKKTNQIMSSSAGTTNSTVTQMMNTAPSLSMSQTQRFNSRKINSNLQRTSSTMQNITKMLHQPTTNRPTVRPLGTLPITLAHTTKCGTSRTKSASISSTLMPRNDVFILSTLKRTGRVDTSSTLKSTDKSEIITTAKPIDKVDTLSTLKQINNVDILSTLKVTDKVGILSTLKPTDKVQTGTTLKRTEKVPILSTLKPTVKIDILSTLKTTDKVNISSTLKPTKKVDISSTLKLTDKDNILSTLKPTQKVDILSTLKPAGKIDALSTFKPTDKVGILSTLKLTERVATLSSLRSADKVDTLITLKPVDRPKILSTPKLTDKIVILSTLRSTDLVKILPTSKPIDKVGILSSSKLTNNIVTSSILKSTDMTAGSMNRTSESSSPQESETTTTSKKKQVAVSSTTESLDACVSNSTAYNNTTTSTAFKKQVIKKEHIINVMSHNGSETDTLSSSMYQYQRENSSNSSSIVSTYMNLNATTFKYSEKKSTERTNTIVTSYSRPPEDKPVGENQSSESKTEKNASGLTSLPSTQYFVSNQNVSAVLENTTRFSLATFKNFTRSSFNLQPSSNLKTSRVENNSLPSSFDQKSPPFLVTLSTNPMSNLNETVTTILTRDEMNVTDSITLPINGSTLLIQQPEYTEHYTSGPEQKEASNSNSSVDQTTSLDGTRLPNDTDILLSQSNVSNNVDTNISNTSVQSTSSSKRTRSSRSRKTPTSYVSPSVSDDDDDDDDDDDWPADTTTQANWNVDSLGSAGGYTSNYFTYRTSTDNFLNMDSSTQGSDYDEVSTSANTDFNDDGYSTRSSYSNGYKDAYEYDDITTSTNTNYDDDWGTPSSAGYDYGNKNMLDDNYEVSTQSTYKSYPSDYDDVYDSSTLNTYRSYPSDYDDVYDSSTPSTYRSDPSDYDDVNDPSTKSTYRSYPSDYNDVYAPTTQSTYRSYSADYDDDGYDSSTQSSYYNRYTSDYYDDGYETSTRSGYGYDDFKPIKDDIDDDDDDDEYFMKSKITYDSTSSYSRMQTTYWQTDSDYTSSSRAVTEDESDSDEETTERGVTERVTQSLGTVSVTTKSPYYMNIDYLNFTKKRPKKRWYGYTNTIALNTTTTPYTGPSTRRRETILHQTITRFMPGGVKYRYSKIHWDDSNCDLFNPWSHPPDLSTLFDYYKFRRVHYSKSRTFWEDVKHYFVRFVRIFKRDFRKGKLDG